MSRNYALAVLMVLGCGSSSVDPLPWDAGTEGSATAPAAARSVRDVLDPQGIPYCAGQAPTCDGDRLRHCGGTCADVRVARAHCGACGVQCGEAEACVQGVCQRAAPVHASPPAVLGEAVQVSTRGANSYGTMATTSDGRQLMFLLEELDATGVVVRARFRGSASAGWSEPCSVQVLEGAAPAVPLHAARADTGDAALLFATGNGVHVVGYDALSGSFGPVTPPVDSDLSANVRSADIGSTRDRVWLAVVDAQALEDVVQMRPFEGGELGPPEEVMALEPRGRVRFSGRSDWAVLRVRRSSEFSNWESVLTLQGGGWVLHDSTRITGELGLGRDRLWARAPEALCYWDPQGRGFLACASSATILYREPYAYGFVEAEWNGRALRLDERYPAPPTSDAWGRLWVLEREGLSHFHAEGLRWVASDQLPDLHAPPSRRAVNYTDDSTITAQLHTDDMGGVTLVAHRTDESGVRTVLTYDYGP